MGPTTVETRPRQRDVVRGRMSPIVLLPGAMVLAVLPRSHDGFDDVKLLVLAALVGAAVCQVVWRGRPAATRSLGAAGWAAVAFLAMATVATLGSDAPLVSLVGEGGWFNGLLAYVAGVALLVLLAGRLPVEVLSGVVASLAAGCAVSVLYWLGQLAGWDPLGLLAQPGEFATPNAFYATTSNPNFAGAYAAAALPGAVWLATRPGLARSRRAAWLAVTVLLGAATVGADSLQAPVAAGAGLAVLLLAVTASRSRRLAASAVALGVVFALLVGAGLLRVGPMAVLGEQETFESRTWDWLAAGRMAVDEPLTGVGFARFGGHVRAYRPPDDIVNYGWRTIAYAAHNVPLDMAAGGGLPLLGAYLAFVGLVGVRLVRGLFRLDGARRLLLGVYGGMWAAYQTQSLVSLDVPQLVMLHFLAAGGVLALTARPRDGAAAERPRPAVRFALVGVTLLTVVGLGRLCLAGLLVGISGDRLEQGDNTGALAAAEQAVAVFPWYPPYWAQLGFAADWTGTDGALPAYLRAIEGDPREVFFLMEAARIARETGAHELETSLLRRALVVEPQAAEVKVAAAEAAVDLGELEEARRLVAAALDFDPRNWEARQLRNELLRLEREVRAAKVRD